MTMFVILWGFAFILCTIIYNYYYSFYKDPTRIEVVFWNILAHGLSYGEFLTNGGDKVNVFWSERKYRIANKIMEQLQEGRIVTCVEMDHYYWFLNYIRECEPFMDIRGHYCPKIDKNKNYSNSNLSVSVSTLLNKYDYEVEIVANLNGEDLKIAYSKLCEYYIEDDRNIESFEDNVVSIDYMDFLSKLLGTTIISTMPYVSFDCSCIFWDNNKFSKTEHIESYVDEFKNIADIDYNETGFTGIRFMERKSKHVFDVFVAHLKSGESPHDELKRIESFEPILNHIKKVAYKNYILCMDSNTSKQYQDNMELGYIVDKTGAVIGILYDYLNQFWETDNMYNNIKQTKDTICWKMRAGSKQEKKNGALMADRIDVMLTPKNMYTEQFIPYESKITDEDYKYIIMWRTSKHFRNIIKKECIENKWKNNTSENEFSNNFSKTLLINNISKETNNNKVGEIIDKLYPNLNMPSDHPMVGTIMFLD